MTSATRTDFRPCGVLALLSDFGTQDPYVGLMKGEVLSRAPRAVLVDLTHEVPPQDVRRGAWFLLHARAHFPAGTVFVCVVDPGVGSARSLVLALDRGQAFLGPDNGLLEPALSEAAVVHDIEPRPASFTFHGRDILAPVAGELLAGAPPERVGPRRTRPLARVELARARRTAPGELAAEVLFADRYGNLVLSALERDLDGGAERWEVQVAGAALPLS